MQKIENMYLNALLADATYGIDEYVSPNDYGALYSKLEKAMPTSLSEYIADRFSMISHMETNDFFNLALTRQLGKVLPTKFILA